MRISRRNVDKTREHDVVLTIHGKGANFDDGKLRNTEVIRQTDRQMDRQEPAVDWGIGRWK